MREKGRGGSGSACAFSSTTHLPPTHTLQLRRRVDAQAARIAALEVDLAVAVTERDDVTRERDTLLVNISRLYNTAREELGRREAALKEARAAAGGGGGKGVSYNT